LAGKDLWPGRVLAWERTFSVRGAALFSSGPAAV
jgi:hypothetical protein